MYRGDALGVEQVGHEVLVAGDGRTRGRGAPDHAVATIKEIGPEAFGKQVAESWRGFLGDLGGTIEIERHAGIAAAGDAFVAMVQGRVDPSKGIVIEP